MLVPATAKDDTGAVCESLMTQMCADRSYVQACGGVNSRAANGCRPRLQGESAYLNCAAILWPVLEYHLDHDTSCGEDCDWSHGQTGGAHVVVPSPFALTCLSCALLSLAQPMGLNYIAHTASVASMTDKYTHPDTSLLLSYTVISFRYRRRSQFYRERLGMIRSAQNVDT